MKLNRGHLSMLDALGAKDANPLTFIKRIDNIIAELNTGNELNSSTKHSSKTKRSRLTAEDANKETLVAFGDTLILTNEAKDKDFAESLAYIASKSALLLQRSLSEYRIAYRGSISYGEYVLDKNTDRFAVLGPAVSDVAYWYEMADWMGIILTPDAGLRLSKRVIDSTQKSLILFEYNVPLKDKRRLKLWTVGWPMYYLIGAKNTSAARQRFLNDLEKLNKVIPFGTENKYLNTIEYFDTYCNTVWKCADL